MFLIKRILCFYKQLKILPKMLKISKNIVLIKKSLTQGFISSIKTKKTDSISTRFFNTQNPYIRLG